MQKWFQKHICMSWRKAETGSLDTTSKTGMEGGIEIFCFDLSLDPLHCRFDIGSSNKEEEFLDIRLNPQYLLHKHYEHEETKKQQAPPLRWSAVHCADTLHILEEYWTSPEEVPFPRKQVETVIRMLLPLKYRTTTSASTSPIIFESASVVRVGLSNIR